jgi:gamma-glutamyltranspeptidase/glutathione hydrolase
MAQFTTRPEIQGNFGVVASTHWIASSVGMSILERGGNAFDAAVAAGFVLQVVEPHLVGPGGDLPAIVYSAAKKRSRSSARKARRRPAPPSSAIAPRA